MENYGSDKGGESITEEHIMPDAAGGKLTTFLCTMCNSTFGRKQTRWLAEWIELNEGGAPFYLDPKKQKTSLDVDGRRVNGTIRLSDDGELAFTTDRKRSNHATFDAFWSEPKPSKVKIEYRMPIFSNEQSLRVGYLTAAYGLWFKNFGYSFVLQSSLEKVRKQILHPEKEILDWEFLIEVPEQEIEEPRIGLIRIDEMYFPFASIYDHIVLLPSAHRGSPTCTPQDRISKKIVSFGEPLAPCFQHRCVGPVDLVIDGQVLIKPDLFANPSVQTERIHIPAWM